MPIKYQLKMLYPLKSPDILLFYLAKISFLYNITRFFISCLLSFTIIFFSGGKCQHRIRGLFHQFNQVWIHQYLDPINLRNFYHAVFSFPVIRTFSTLYPFCAFFSFFLIVLFSLDLLYIQKGQVFSYPFM